MIVVPVLKDDGPAQSDVHVDGILGGKKPRKKKKDENQPDTSVPILKVAHDVSGEPRVESGPGGGEWTAGGATLAAPKISEERRKQLHEAGKQALTSLHEQSGEETTSISAAAVKTKITINEVLTSDVSAHTVGDKKFDKWVEAKTTEYFQEPRPSRDTLKEVWTDSVGHDKDAEEADFQKRRAQWEKKVTPIVAKINEVTGRTAGWKKVSDLKVGDKFYLDSQPDSDPKTITKIEVLHDDVGAYAEARRLHWDVDMKKDPFDTGFVRERKNDFVPTKPNMPLTSMPLTLDKAATAFRVLSRDTQVWIDSDAVPSMMAHDSPFAIKLKEVLGIPYDDKIAGAELWKKFRALPDFPTQPVHGDNPIPLRPMPKDDGEALRQIVVAKTVRDYIDTWAGSSGDSTIKSLALQQAIAKNFKIPDQYIKPLRDYAESPSSTQYSDGKTTWKHAQEQYAKDKPFLDQFVNDVYANTQKTLKKNKVSEMLLWRGMHVDDMANPHRWLVPPVVGVKYLGVGYRGTERYLVNFDETPQERKLVLQPGSAWSVDRPIAERFTGDDTTPDLMLQAVVPAARIWSLASASGPGCLNEREAIVMGGSGTARVEWNKWNDNGVSYDGPGWPTSHPEALGVTKKQLAKAKKEYEEIHHDEALSAVKPGTSLLNQTTLSTPAHEIKAAALIDANGGYHPLGMNNLKTEDVESYFFNHPSTGVADVNYAMISTWKKNGYSDFSDEEVGLKMPMVDAKDLKPGDVISLTSATSPKYTVKEIKPNPDTSGFNITLADGSKVHLYAGDLAYHHGYSPLKKHTGGHVAEVMPIDTWPHCDWIKHGSADVSMDGTVISGKVRQQRLMKQLVPVMKGDIADHPFHGNQWETGESGPETQFDGPVVHRGINLQLTPDEQNQINALMQPPTSPEEYNQHFKVGDMLAKKLQGYKGHPGLDEGGVGRNYTTDPLMAETAGTHGAQGGMPVVVSVATRKADQQTDPNQLRDLNSLESEYRLKPGSPVKINDVRIMHGPKYESVFDTKGEGTGEPAYNRSYNITPPVQHITPDEARGNSRPVSAEEFTHLADQGNARLADYEHNASPPTGLDQHWDDVVSNAYAESQKSWGGVTVDSHTGEPYPGDKGFALTVKSPGQQSVTIPENADQPHFAAAMKEARQRFDPQLQRPDHHLGVFHDDDTHQIDIDPVLVVQTPQEVEEIGAATHAIGGAYDFSTGDGYFPPHVSEQDRVTVAKMAKRKTHAQFHAESRDANRPVWQPRPESKFAGPVEVLKVAHDVSGEGRDDHGRWTAVGDVELVGTHSSHTDSRNYTARIHNYDENGRHEREFIEGATTKADPSVRYGGKQPPTNTRAIQHRLPNVPGVYETQTYFKGNPRQVDAERRTRTLWHVTGSGDVHQLRPEEHDAEQIQELVDRHRVAKSLTILKVAGGPQWENENRDQGRFSDTAGSGAAAKSPDAKSPAFHEPVTNALDPNVERSDRSTGGDVITGLGITEIPPTFEKRMQAKAASMNISEDTILDQLESHFAKGEIKNGAWYHKLHDECLDVAKRTGQSIESTAGIASVIAAKRLWPKNRKDIESICNIVKDNKSFTITQAQADEFNSYKPKKKGMPPRQHLDPGEYKPTTADPIVTCLYDPEVKKAKLVMLTGTPPIIKALLIATGRGRAQDIITGPKLKNFYNNIVNPYDPRFATIDTWMYRSGIDPKQKFEGTRDGKKGQYNLEEWTEPFEMKNKDGSPKLDPKTGKVKMRNVAEQNIFQQSPGAITENKVEVFPSGVGLYPLFQRAVLRGAKLHHLVPNEYQAVIWQQLVDEAGGKAYVE